MLSPNANSSAKYFPGEKRYLRQKTAAGPKTAAGEKQLFLFFLVFGFKFLVTVARQAFHDKVFECRHDEKANKANTTDDEQE